jgi:hypothetical protein
MHACIRAQHQIRSLRCAAFLAVGGGGAAPLWLVDATGAYPVRAHCMGGGSVRMKRSAAAAAIATASKGNGNSNDDDDDELIPMTTADVLRAMILAKFSSSEHSTTSSSSDTAAPDTTSSRSCCFNIPVKEAAREILAMLSTEMDAIPMGASITCHAAALLPPKTRVEIAALLRAPPPSSFTTAQHTAEDRGGVVRLSVEDILQQ